MFRYYAIFAAMTTDLQDKLSETCDRFASEIIAIFANAFENTVSSLSSSLPASSPSKKLSSKLPKAATAPIAKAPKAGKPTKAAKTKASEKPGQRVRRSEADLAKTGEQIVKLLQKHKGGLRIEQVNKEIGTSTKELMRPILKLLEEGKIRKEGERRATTYFAK